MDTVLAHVRLRGREGMWHVGIQDGIVHRLSEEAFAGEVVIDAGGGLLTAGLVEAHLHMDKTLTADRISWEAERPTGRDYRRFQDEIFNPVKQAFTTGDIFQRAGRVARMASAAGTTAIRAQCDVDDVLELRGIQALLRLRAEIRSFMDLQIVAMPLGQILDRPDVVALVHRALELGADAVGGLPELDPERAEAYIDTIFRIAHAHNAAVDMHVDQPWEERLFSFPIMAAKAHTYGLKDRVTGAHANSLAYQPKERVTEALHAMREAGVHLACLPYSFVDERIKRPKAMGINVSLINDNVRDPWQRGGSADLVQMAMIYARTGTVRTDAGLEDAFDMITVDGARSLGLKDYGVQERCRADLVLFDAATVQEVITCQRSPRFVFKAGRMVAQEGRSLW